MGGFAAALPYIAQAGSAALPLVTDPKAPNQTNMTAAPSSRNVRMPQGMATQQQPQPGQEEAMMQMLFALMQQLGPMMGNQPQQSPMEQAISGAQAGPPVQSINRPQPMPTVPLGGF